MKRMLLIAAGIVLSAQISACSTTAQTKVSTTASDIQTAITKACAVFGPVATDAQALYTLDAKMDLALDGVTALCTTNASIDTSTVQTLAQTTIPAAVKALAAMPGVSDDVKREIGGALTLANVALNAAVVTYSPAAQ